MIEIYIGLLVVISAVAAIYYFASAKKGEKEVVTDRPKAVGYLEQARELLEQEMEEQETTEVTPLQAPVDLTQVRGIGPKRAERLKAIGIKDIDDLVESDPAKIAKALSVSKKISSRLIPEALSEKYKE
ncbi:MAG: helix-hairpin-helix domain-containing protein [Candidatus Bathyarchaeota archaeon]|nr:helix-hairpin-helix domain-containing protein [Candidatus Bathyarchaeota archaeon]